MASAVTSGQPTKQVPQVARFGTLGHKKAPQVILGRLSKMEQAKRLELIRILLQALGEQLGYFDGISLDALGAALDEENPSLDRREPGQPDSGSPSGSSPQGACLDGSGGRENEPPPNLRTDEAKGGA